MEAMNLNRTLKSIIPAAADPCSTAYIQYSLRMSRSFHRHVCRETSSYALGGISPAHISLATADYEHVVFV